MLSHSKTKQIGFLKSTKTKWLIFKETREWRPSRAHGFSETIYLDGDAPRRHATRRVLYQPQRPRPIKRRHRPAVTLESLNIDSLTLPLAFTFLTT